jgi:hypothetical protein
MLWANKYHRYILNYDTIGQPLQNTEAQYCQPIDQKPFLFHHAKTTIHIREINPLPFVLFRDLFFELSRIHVRQKFPSDIVRLWRLLADWERVAEPVVVQVIMFTFP